MADDKRFILPTWARSLSARVLLLTVFFVMLAEVLIYIPSLANFRTNWLGEKIASAHLAVITLEAAAVEEDSQSVRQELLERLGVHAVVLRRPDRLVLLSDERPPAVDTTIMLNERGGFASVTDALRVLAQRDNRIVRLIGAEPETPDLEVEIVFDEADLHRAMMIFSRNVLLLSLAISAIAAVLLYTSLQFLIVRPMRRLTEKITEFAHNPEDGRVGVVPTGRTDEIGVAQQVLAEMQNEIRAAMTQKEHLAALGSAVSKINHDLRSILSTAVLISDRLTQVEDPEVRRISPPLIQAIDRAIALCTQTLNFARDGEPDLTRSRFRLLDLVKDVANDFAVFESGLASVASKVEPDLAVEADRDQLYRVFANLARNAFESGAYNVEIAAEKEGNQTIITISDDGPGMSQLAIAGMFKPFVSSSKQGGTGLGLSISRDVMRAHRGDIELMDSEGKGTVFRLTLPN